MNKGFIIGMAGLGVGLALAGGVGGYFIGKANTSTTPVESEVVEESTEIREYELPEGFEYVSYSKYAIGDKFYLLSSSSLGTYLLDTETGKSSFFNAGYIYSRSDEINGKVFIWTSTNNLLKIDIETGEYEVVSLNSGISFSMLDFIENNTDRLFARGYNNRGEYYFIDFDIEEGESKVFSITTAIYNYITFAIEQSGNYFLTYYTTSSSGSFSSYLLNGETGEIESISNCYRNSSNLPYILRGNQLYIIQYQYSYGYRFYKIDLSELTYTTLDTASGINSASKIYSLENGIILVPDGTYSNYTNYGSAYYISDDDVVTQLSYDDRTYISGFEIEGHLFFAIGNNTSSYLYGYLTTFDEESLTLKEVYKTLTSNTYSSPRIYELNGNLIINDGSNYTDSNSSKIFIDENGELFYERISLKRYCYNYNFIEIDNNRYIYYSGTTIFYYDFENDIYKTISESSFSLSSYYIDGNYVYIYGSNNVKYEFNSETTILKAVAYWE